jgi:hypothetical protein
MRILSSPVASSWENIQSELVKGSVFGAFLCIDGWVEDLGGFV